MSDESSEIAAQIVSRLARSLAALTAMQTYRAYHDCVKAGRDPDACFLEAFMGIYETPGIPRPPEPFASLEDLYEALVDTPTVFSESEKLVEAALADLKPLLNARTAQKPI